MSLLWLIGIAFISVNEEKLRRIIFVMVSLAVGALFGDAFIHLLPESFERSQSTIKTSLYVLAGMLSFFVLEKFLYGNTNTCWIPVAISTQLVI